MCGRLVMDRSVREIWPGVLVAADIPVGVDERVASVAPELPRDAVLVRHAAVWAHTGIDRPHVVDVVQRTRHRSRPRVAVHADRLRSADILVVTTGRVTTLGRTAVDVARWAPADRLETWLCALVGAGLTRDAVDEALARAAGLIGVIRARDVLAGLVLP